LTRAAQRALRWSGAVHPRNGAAQLAMRI